MTIKVAAFNSDHGPPYVHSASSYIGIFGHIGR